MDSTGQEFNSRSGTVDIPDAYMSELASSTAVTSGILRAGQSFNLGTKVGRVCPDCPGNRIEQAWVTECPRCHQPTVLENRGSGPKVPSQ